MASMIGTLATDGQTVTLTTGSLASWITASSAANVCQVYGYGLPNSGNDWTPQFTAQTTLASITSSTQFVITPAVAGLGSPITNIKIVIAQQWAAANDQWWQNVSGTLPPGASPTSIGAGYFGSDGNDSTDLRPAGVEAVLWLNADTSWATAAGQGQFAGCAFIHQSVGIQTIGNTSIGPQLATDSLAFRTGSSSATTPAESFPAPYPSTFSWMVGGTSCVNEYCFLVNGAPVTYPFGFTAPGASPTYWVKNIGTSGNPTMPWNWQIEMIPNPFGAGSLGGAPGGYDNGDGYLYSLPAGSNRSHYVTRFPKADLNIASTGTPSLMRPQYWCGPSGWVGVDMLTSAVQPSLGTETVVAPNSPGLILDGTAWVVKKSNGTVLWVNDIFDSESSLGFYNIAPSITSPVTSGGSYSGWNAFWDVSLSETSVTAHYNWQIHPEQAWTGQTTDDFCVSYSCNSSNGGWARWLRVSGM